MASQFVSIAAQRSVFRSARSPVLIVFDEDVCTVICCSNSSHKFSGYISHNIFDNLVTRLGFLYSGFLQHEAINVYFYFTCPHPTFDKTQWHSSLLPVTHFLRGTTAIHWLLAAALHEAFFFFFFLLTGRNWNKWSLYCISPSLDRNFVVTGQSSSSITSGTMRLCRHGEVRKEQNRQIGFLYFYSLVGVTTTKKLTLRRVCEAFTPLIQS